MMPRPYWITSMTSIVTLMCLSLAQRSPPRPLGRVCRASPILALPLPRSHPLTTAPQPSQFTPAAAAAVTAVSGRGDPPERAAVTFDPAQPGKRHVIRVDEEILVGGPA